MKKRFAALLLLCWLIPASMAWAEPPVSVSHTLTGYTMGTDWVVLNYTLKVTNTGSGSLSNLVLSLDPLYIMSQDLITLNIATLWPQEEINIPFTVTSHMLVEQDVIRHLYLIWDCEGTVADSSSIIFPILSVEGGAL